MAKYLFDPWLEIEDMKERVDRLSGGSRGESSLSGAKAEQHPLWKPPADVYETAEGYILEIELAGIEKDSIHLESRDNALFVYGERRREQEAGGSTYHLLERSYGTFARKFLLPEDVDVATTSAVHRNGVLTITLRKQPREVISRKIVVREE
ncbi:MAG: Hsp20/alpha crystallin family protein [Desulfovibrionales bacterium]